MKKKKKKWIQWCTAGSTEQLGLLHQNSLDSLQEDDGNDIPTDWEVKLTYFNTHVIVAVLRYKYIYLTAYGLLKIDN